MAYAWTEYVDGSYAVAVRRIDARGGAGPVRRLTGGSDYALHPSLATTTGGRLWCAFDVVSVHGHGGSGPTRLRPRPTREGRADGHEGMRERGQERAARAPARGQRAHPGGPGRRRRAGGAARRAGARAERGALGAAPAAGHRRRGPGRRLPDPPAATADDVLLGGGRPGARARRLVPADDVRRYRRHVGGGRRWPRARPARCSPPRPTGACRAPCTGARGSAGASAPTSPITTAPSSGTASTGRDRWCSRPSRRRVPPRSTADRSASIVSARAARGPQVDGSRTRPSPGRAGLRRLLGRPAPPLARQPLHLGRRTLAGRLLPLRVGRQRVRLLGGDGPRRELHRVPVVEHPEDRRPAARPGPLRAALRVRVDVGGTRPPERHLRRRRARGPDLLRLRRGQHDPGRALAGAGRAPAVPGHHDPAPPRLGDGAQRLGLPRPRLQPARRGLPGVPRQLRVGDLLPAVLRRHRHRHVHARRAPAGPPLRPHRLLRPRPRRELCRGARPVAVAF